MYVYILSSLFLRYNRARGIHSVYTKEHFSPIRYLYAGPMSLGGPLYIIPYHIIYSTFMSIAAAHYVLTHSVTHHH